MNYFDAPDPARSIAALACSVLAHYGLTPPNPTLPLADALLKRAPRNVVLLLLDGLGLNLLEETLPPHSFLRRRLAASLSSVFPPTTTAAATALESGLYPAQHGWLGWSVYWEALGQNVNLYPNTTQDGAPAAPVHLGETHLSFSSLVHQIRERTGISSLALSGQGDGSAARGAGLWAALERITQQPGPHFVYGYLNQPDQLLHRKGCASAEARGLLLELNRRLEALTARLPDTLILITADHGLLDVEGLCLEDFPALANTLALPPSIEPRALNCFVRPGLEEAFRTELNRAVGNSYTLYTRAEAVEAKLFGPGPPHPRFHSMLGSFIAVAHTPLTLFPTRQYQRSMVAAHGGMTAFELTVPLICSCSHAH